MAREVDRDGTRTGSVLTIYYSLLTTHYSLLTAYYLRHNTYHLTLTSHCPLPTTPYPLPTTHYPLLTTYYLLLTAFCELLATCYLLLTLTRTGPFEVQGRRAWSRLADLPHSRVRGGCRPWAVAVGRAPCPAGSRSALLSTCY